MKSWIIGLCLIVIGYLASFLGAPFTGGVFTGIGIMFVLNIVRAPEKKVKNNGRQ